MKSKNKIITAVLLAAGTAAGTARNKKNIKYAATPRSSRATPSPPSINGVSVIFIIQKLVPENPFF